MRSTITAVAMLGLVAVLGCVAAKVVRVEFNQRRKRDNFGRLICTPLVADLNVAAELVRLGVATWREHTERGP